MTVQSKTIPAQGSEEEELIKRIAAGEKELFEIIVRRFPLFVRHLADKDHAQSML